MLFVSLELAFISNDPTTTHVCSFLVILGFLLNENPVRTECTIFFNVHVFDIDSQKLNPMVVNIFSGVKFIKTHLIPTIKT